MAEKRWVRRSKMAIWWMSNRVARRTRAKSGWPVGVGSGSVVAVGVGSSGGGVVEASIFLSCSVLCSVSWWLWGHLGVLA